ncbi:presequence translocated-associated motor subunit PAM17 [Coprinopsis marcescibilis]|uniref:Presequence translocated-associated motor subunit PAM17 n=1 Tax=Coprinopsis marcescibilis TaxID=230819 RepID=A0A5C3LCF5_COPMA|nr:presequence translocated-associated motor subunit PAM17 [Coprinopsis marcescibilis]
MSISKALRVTRSLATQANVSNPAKAPGSESKPVRKGPSKLDLTWPQYLAIRKSRRRWENVATVPAGIAGFAAGIAYFGSLETDPMKLIFGFDPFMVYGFLTVACAGTGAVVGPTIGRSMWRWSHRNQVQIIDEKDREFLRRIAKNRVDASLQSPTAPVPDYYGERIGSLHQYRQWLRDQNKYRRKVLLPEKDD